MGTIFFLIGGVNAAHMPTRRWKLNLAQLKKKKSNLDQFFYLTDEQTNEIIQDNPLRRSPTSKIILFIKIDKMIKIRL